MDGIWTDNDWQDTISGVGVKNGVPYGLTEENDRRIKAPITLAGSQENYSETQNVQLVQSFLTCDAWLGFFPDQSVSDVYTYESFLSAIAKFPAFCNEAIDY